MSHTRSLRAAVLFPMVLAMVLAALSVAGCKSSPPAPDATVADAGIAAGFLGPDDHCPGSAHCEGTGDGKLHVGAGKASFTPVIVETWTDVNGDSEWQSNEPYVDADGDGKFDAYWIAGFGSGRAANGVSDDLEARALAFRHGDTLVAICYLDVVGFFTDEMDAIRQDARLAEFAIDHIVLGSTHVHESVDTIGLWGRNELQTGYQADFQATVRDAAVLAIRDAVTGLKPARMIIAQGTSLDDPSDPTSGTTSFHHDIRDPVIYDPTITVARFVDEAAPDVTIGTLLAWTSHPETGGDENLLLSADFPHWFRETVEQGLPDEGLEGLGGVALFVQGALGGQIGPLHGVAVPGPDGTPITSLGLAKAQALGTNLARRALEALRDDGETSTETAVSYRSTEMFARVDNVGFQTLFLIDVLAPHRLVGYDTTKPIVGANIPWIPLRTTYLQVGPLATITAPGELHPELWVGGYDGSWSWGYPILSPDVTENVPDLADAPAPPYLRDLVLANPGVRYAILAGCAEDYAGYILPAFNYVLHPDNPYIEEANGQHYEETRSLGPEVEEHVVDVMQALAAWRP